MDPLHHFDPDLVAEADDRDGQSRNGLRDAEVPFRLGLVVLAQPRRVRRLRRCGRGERRCRRCFIVDLFADGMQELLDQQDVPGGGVRAELDYCLRGSAKGLGEDFQGRVYRVYGVLAAHVAKAET